MKNSQRSPRLAVLIDGENITADIADGLFREIAKIGDARLRRIYGNFSKPQLKSWHAVIERHQLERIDVPAHVKGKNVSDIALAIDAIDLFHIGRFDGFCLVSSDSDYTRLAALLGRRGINVYGFGEQKTPETFQRACHEFMHTEGLRAQPKEPASDKAAKSAPPKTVSEAIAVLNDILSGMRSKSGDWVSLSVVGKQFPKSGYKAFGAKNLFTLVSKTDSFDIEKAEGGHMRMRAKLKVAGSKSKN